MVSINHSSGSSPQLGPSKIDIRFNIKTKTNATDTSASSAATKIIAGKDTPSCHTTSVPRQSIPPSTQTEISDNTMKFLGVDKSVTKVEKEEAELKKGIALFININKMLNSNQNKRETCLEKTIESTLQKSLKCFETVLSSDPNNEQALLFKAKIKNLDNEQDEALKLLDKLIKMEGTCLVYAHGTKGNIMYAQKNLEKALCCYEEVINTIEKIGEVGKEDYEPIIKWTRNRIENLKKEIKKSKEIHIENEMSYGLFPDNKEGEVVHSEWSYGDNTSYEFSSYPEAVASGFLPYTKEQEDVSCGLLFNNCRLLLSMSTQSDKTSTTSSELLSGSENSTNSFLNQLSESTIDESIFSHATHVSSGHTSPSKDHIDASPTKDTVDAADNNWEFVDNNVTIEVSIVFNNAS